MPKEFTLYYAQRIMFKVTYDVIIITTDYFPHMKECKDSQSIDQLVVLKA